MADAMKRTPSETPAAEAADDLLPEYDFDYSKARPNRFVPHPAEKGRTIVLDPDIATIFKSSESVNAVLRALIRTMPDMAH